MSKIYELAEQAAEHAVLNPSDQILQSETEDSKVEVPKEFIDKFAELIIARMLDIVESHSEIFQTERDRAVIEHIKQSAKTDFGVEE